MNGATALTFWLSAQRYRCWKSLRKRSSFHTCCSWICSGFHVGSMLCGKCHIRFPRHDTTQHGTMRHDWFIQRQKSSRVRISNMATTSQEALPQDLGKLHILSCLSWSMCYQWKLVDNELCNSDQTGFMIGMICSPIVDRRADRCGKGK